MPSQYLPSRLQRALPYALLTLAGGTLLPALAGGLPCSDDALPHLLRTVGFDLNLRGGAPFLQWGPDFMRGYGYPIFAFYAPLTYWLMEALHLAGLPLSIAFTGLLWAALIGAGWGAYALARWWLPIPAALAAGLAYQFAPYLLYDAIPRGALPETLALAWLPFALLAALRAARQPSRGRVITAGLLLALMQLTHNVVPLLAMTMAVVLAASEAHRQPAARAWQAWARPLLQRTAPVAAAVAVSLALTAAFWLPAVAELRYTQSATDAPADGPLRNWPRFYQHILPVAALLEWPVEPGDSQLLNPPITRTLGVAQAGLALVGVVGLAHPTRAPLRRPFALVVVVLAGCLFLASTPSYWLWERIGALNFIQLPTRFLGPGSLALALLAGLGVAAAWQAVRARWQAAALLALAVCGLGVSGWPWLYPRYCPLAEPVTRAGLVQSSTWERRQAESADEVLPRWVRALPDPDGLLPQYLSGEPVNRLRWPSGAAQLASWQTRPAFDAYTLQVSQPSEFVYHTFYFPGWVVRLDGQPVPARPTELHGLIAFDMPAGTHTLQIAFGPTPLRRWTLAFSALAAVLVAVVSLCRRATRQPPTPSAAPAHLSRATAAIMAGAVAALWLLVLAVPPLVNTPFVADRLRGQQAADLAGGAWLDFGGELALMSANFPARVAAGAELPVTLYWTAQHDLGVPYGMDVRLVDELGQVWSAGARRPFGYADYPGTESWPPNTYARDAYAVALRTGTPPGTYWLEVNVFRRDVTQALMPAPGTPTGLDPAFVRLGMVTVAGVQREISAATAGVSRFAPHDVAPGLHLVGWSAPETISSGELAHIELVWQGTLRRIGAEAAALELVSADGTVAGVHHWPIGGSGFPTSAWPLRSVVRDQLDIRMAPALASGEYQLRLRADNQLTAIDLGRLQLSAPQRSFVPPAVNTPLQADMGPARLTGFSLSADHLAPGAQFQVDLAWQALAETETNLRVFIHLRDARGAIVAQADGEPVNWTRPTISWLTGEYLLDTHTLTLPADLAAGNYTLAAGLYDPATGQRYGEAVVALMDTQ